jgi:hypothetical protein
MRSVGECVFRCTSGSVASPAQRVPAPAYLTAIACEHGCPAVRRTGIQRIVAMNREQAAKIFLVRSVEECDETAFSRDVLKKALDVDGHTVGSTEWFSARADYLYGEMPAAYKSIVHMAAFPRGALPILCGLSFILGLWANYMGPGNTIHVVFNPIVLLVVWNVLVYLSYVVLPIVTWLRSGAAANGPHPAADNVQPAPAVQEPQQRDEGIPPGKKSLLLNVLVPNVWTAIHGLYASARDTTKRALCVGMVAKRFWMYWVRNAGSIVVAGLRGMLHYCALFLTVGAIMGVYARGLFAEYTVVWSSTFIRSEAAALFIIKILLGPAMLCANALGWNVSEEINISAMMEQGGVLAATWIHLYVMTAIACIIIPRWLLGVWEGRRVQQAEKNIDIAIDRYFAEKIEAQVADIITYELRAACIRVSERIAGFVCTDLYDARIIADMDAFRNRGGSISELRDTIRATCRGFEPEMTEGINRIVEDFEKALTLKIQQIIKSLHIAAKADRAVCQDWPAMLENGHNAIVGQSVQSIGNGVSHTVHAVLSLRGRCGHPQRWFWRGSGPGSHDNAAGDHRAGGVSYRRSDRPRACGRRAVDGPRKNAGCD